MPNDYSKLTEYLYEFYIECDKANDQIYNF